MHTLRSFRPFRSFRSFMLALVAALTAVVFAPAPASALPYGCSASYGPTVAQAHCTSPSYTGQVRVKHYCRLVTNGVVYTTYGPWVPSGAPYVSWSSCTQLGGLRWGWRSVGAYYQIR